MGYNSAPAESVLGWAEGIYGRLQHEIENGGSESPCPFCSVPRVKRSDYTRCCGCGVNWLIGEDLTRDPRMSRLSKPLSRLGDKNEVPEM